MPTTWSRFWHIADQEYTQGGGWLCIEVTTGRLVLIDLDQKDPIYQVNAGLLNFYTTLAYFLDWTESTAGTFEETRLLRDALHKQCAIPLEELQPFWMNIIDATLDQEGCRLRVTLG